MLDLLHIKKIKVIAKYNHIIYPLPFHLSPNPPYVLSSSTWKLKPINRVNRVLKYLQSWCVIMSLFHLMSSFQTKHFSSRWRLYRRDFIIVFQGGITRHQEWFSLRKQKVPKFRDFNQYLMVLWNYFDCAQKQLQRYVFLEILFHAIDIKLSVQRSGI